MRSRALACAVAAIGLAAAARAQLLTVTKGPLPTHVRLSWTATTGAPYDVTRAALADGSDRVSLTWLCGPTWLDATATSPPGGVLYYDVKPYAGPNALRAEAGPDVLGGSVIGGLPAFSGGTPPCTYDWLPRLGLSDSTTSNPTANPSSETVYTVTVFDSAGCMATDSVTVFVPTGPLVADAGSDPAGPVPCSFASSTALGGAPSASGGVGPYTYAWSPHDGLYDASRNPTWDEANPLLVPSTDQTYTLTVTDRFGQIATDDVAITVDGSLTHCAGFGNYASPPDFCANDFTRDDADCNSFQMHSLRCNVVLLQFGEFT